MIVIFEGLDNCGKTTLIKMISNYYNNTDVDTEISKEFETNIGRELKKMAKDGHLDSVLKSYLFAADRYIRMQDIYERNANDKLLLFDRYVPSAIAYRMAEGIDKDWITTINSVFPKHDLGFYIDITPEESISRRTDDKFNIDYSLDQLNRIRESYHSISEENNLIPINGMQPIESIFNTVIYEIEEYMKNNEKRI